MVGIANCGAAADFLRAILAGLAHGLGEVGVVADQAAVDHGVALIDDRSVRQEPDDETALDAGSAGSVPTEQDGTAILVPLTGGMPVMDFLDLPAEVVGIEPCL